MQVMHIVTCFYFTVVHATIFSNSLAVLTPRLRETPSRQSTELSIFYANRMNAVGGRVNSGQCKENNQDIRENM